MIDREASALFTQGLHLSALANQARPLAALGIRAEPEGLPQPRSK